MGKRLLQQTKKGSNMVLFRILTVLIAIYAFYLYNFRLSAGMLPVWMVLLFASLLMSFEKINAFILSFPFLKGLIVFGLVVFLIVELFIIRAGFEADISDESDYIVVLGAKVNGERMSRALRYRAEVALEYLELHEETKAVLSGGQGSDEGISEAEAIRRYLVAEGIDETRLIMEDQSTSTVENLTYSKVLIINDLSYSNEEAGLEMEDILEHTDILVVSSRFHLFRSKIIGNRLGLDIQGIGAKSFPLLLPNYYLREFFGVVATVFFGYND